MTLFRHLKSVWKFEDNDDFDFVDNKSVDKSKTCLLDFAVSFQFRFGFSVKTIVVWLILWVYFNELILKFIVLTWRLFLVIWNEEAVLKLLL